MCYDIGDDRRRGRAAKVCLGFGNRVQESVFEAELTAQQLKKLRQRLERLIKPGEDSLRIYKLCSECVKQVEVVSGPEVTRTPRVVVI